MTEQAISRVVHIDSPDSGHGTLSAAVNDHPGLMPVLISRGGYEVHMRWSEWEEIRDHVEYCSTMKLEEDDPYEVCNAMPGLVPYDALPCVLEEGHGVGDLETGQPLGTAHHMDRRGRAW